MTETVETTTEEFAPFTEGEREIAYRAEAVASSAAPGERPAVIGAADATGRRKEAIARVRLTPGTGQFRINGRSLEEYFPNKLHQQTVNEPFETAAVAGSYDVVAKIVGGGVTGQAGALRLGEMAHRTESAIETIGIDGIECVLQACRGKDGDLFGCHGRLG